jgi:hypothetical protein
LGRDLRRHLPAFRLVVCEERHQDAGHQVQLVQRCLVVFFAMGLALYVIFFVQP